jgi:hypothetical protein
MLKEADIKNKSKMVELQMSKSRDDILADDNDFLNTLTSELGGRT